MTHFRYGAIRPMRVLLVEDDELLGSGICDALERTRYTVEWVRDGAQALEALRGSGVDLAVLDLGLPRMDGMEVLRRAREAGVTTPVLVLSARDTTLQRIGGLDAGADDYLTKPFSVGELLARMRVALRHAARAQQPAQMVFRAGSLQVDLVKRVVTVAGRETHLSPTEYKLLATLIRHAGMVCTQRQLMREVWGSHVVDDTQNLRVVVAQLRRKIEADTARPRLLQTEPGVGYRLRDDVAIDSPPA